MIIRQLKVEMIYGMIMSGLLVPAIAFADPTNLLYAISNPHGENFWGASIASCGDETFLVGSINNYKAGTDVPVYRINALTGQILQTYSEPDLPKYAGSDIFGSELTMVNNLVLVGTYSDDGASQAGSVHVYNAEGGDYLRTIYHPNPKNSGSFGISMAPLENLAIIGTFTNSAAYVIDPSTGFVNLKIGRPSGSLTKNFGASVAAIQSDILVGGRSSSVYRFDGITGAIKASYNDPGMSGLFGFTIAGAGSKVLVGAKKAHGTESKDGVCYVFDANSGTLLKTISNPDPDKGGWFGMDISVYNDRYALIGDPMDASKNGVAYLYDLETYSLLAEFVNPEPLGYSAERFGENLTWAGDVAIISAWRDQGYEGKVYAFEGFVPQSVDIDIKPGSDRNPVNLKSKGKLPVVLFGSEEVDVSEIDLATLLLNGVALPEKNNGKLFASFDDEDDDGFRDLIMHFILQDLGIEAGTEELLISGSFLDGSIFKGSDSISIVPPGDANGDGIVSAADYASVQACFGEAGDVGDANGDGVISAADYASVQANFGNAAAVEAIPEPVTMGLLAIGGLAMLRRRRK
jgi:hypothetical protein